MNVLHVIPSFYPAHCYGGPVRSVYALSRNLAMLGCNVRVLTTNANGPGSVLDVSPGRETELSDGVRVTYCKRILPDAVSPSLVARLPEYVGWADVVHLTAVYSFPVIPALIACRHFRKPVLWSPRGSLQRWAGSTRPGVKAKWDSFCSRVRPRNVRLHVTSPQEAAESRLCYPDVGSVIIPNGVEIPETVEHRESDGTLRLLFIGRLHPKKGIENLMDACALLKNAGTRVSLAIAGSGDEAYTETLRARAGHLGISNEAKLLGEVLGSRKRELFEAADLAVFPSYTENFGLVVAEALAHGVPVIASRGTPWQEVVDRGCGLWVENDPVTLKDAILQCAAMPLRAMGSRGREWMLAEYSWSKAAADTLRAYQDLIESAGVTSVAPAGSGQSERDGWYAKST